MSLDADQPRAAEPGPDAAARLGPGLTYRVAENLQQALDAWQLVYTAYRRIGLVDPNPYRLHTAPHAVGPHAAVICGMMGPLTVSTLTVMVDAPGQEAAGPGLPLDRVYPAELAALRRSGRRLMEVGLFADRRKQLSRTAESLFQLMRFAFFFGVAHEVTDFVIGVHPRHGRFYVRAFGFEQVGELKSYAAVNDRPVVLLRGDMDLEPKLRNLHPALRYFKRNPVPPETFVNRFRFGAAEIAGSALEAFLREKHPAGVGA